MTQEDLNKYGLTIFRVDTPEHTMTVNNGPLQTVAASSQYKLYEAGGNNMSAGIRDISAQDVAGLDPSLFKVFNSNDFELSKLSALGYGGAGTSKANLQAGGLEGLISQYRQNALASQPAVTGPLTTASTPAPTAPNDLPRYRDASGNLVYGTAPDNTADVRQPEVMTQVSQTPSQVSSSQVTANTSKYTPLTPSALAQGTTLKESDLARTTGVNIYRRDLAAEQAAMPLYTKMYGAPKTDADWRKFHDYVYEGKGVNPATPSTSPVSSGVPSGTSSTPTLSQPNATSTNESFVRTGITAVDTARQTLEDAYNKQIADLKAQQAQIQKQIDAATAGQMQGLVGEKSIADQKNADIMAALRLEQQRTDDAYNAKVALTNRLEGLLQQGQDLIAQQKNATGLGPIKDPRVAQTMSDVAAQAGVIQATLAAYSGNIADAESILQNSVNAVNAATIDQLNYYKDLYNFYVGEKNTALSNMSDLKSSEKQFITAKIGQLENDLKITQDNAKRMADAFTNPETALMYSQAGITLNDSPEQVATKLARFGYSQEVIQQNNEMAKAGYKMAVPGQPTPVGMESLTLTDSKGVKTTWNRPVQINDQGFTLSAGQSRYDANGNLIATGIDSTSSFKTVKVNGQDYIVGADGTLQAPRVPTAPTQEKIAKAEGIITSIDALLNDPNLSKAVGPISSQIPSWLRSGAHNDIDAKFKSLVDSIALENLGLLKGAMSDKDIEFIRSATSGLNLNMSEEGFKNKLLEIRDKFNEIRSKAFIPENDVLNIGGSQNNSANDPLQLIQGFNQGGTGPKTGALAPSSNALSSLITAFSSVFPQGAVGGQCLEFAHKLVDFPRIGDGKNSKFAGVNKYGVVASQWRNDVRVGDVIVTGENPTYGHVAVVNEVLPNGQIRLTESNYNKNEKVTNTRIMSINNPQIYGAIRGNIKLA